MKSQKTKSKSKSKTNKTRKAVPWKGWHKDKPNTMKQRREMFKKCKKHCFLGKKLSFPICRRGTCKHDKRGVWGAYVRARSCRNPRSACRSRAKKPKSTKYYSRIANKAKKLL